jgi:hypothetical protein
MWRSYGALRFVFFGCYKHPAPPEQSAGRVDTAFPLAIMALLRA